MQERNRRVPGEGLVAGRGPHHVARADGPRIGVLALQGDVLEHLRILDAAGARAEPVNRADQLGALDGILMPGGESTTIGKLATLYGLFEPLRERLLGGLPAFGTCAGAILLGQSALTHDGRPSPQPLLGVLDVTTRRNAFGRQVASFEADLAVAGIAGGPMRAVFIRAPWFDQHGREVEVLASVELPADPGGDAQPPHGAEPGAPERGVRVVVVRQGHLLASAFHPELTGDSRLHQLFVELVDKHREG